MNFSRFDKFRDRCRENEKILDRITAENCRRIYENSRKSGSFVIHTTEESMQHIYDEPIQKSSNKKLVKKLIRTKNKGIERR